MIEEKWSEARDQYDFDCSSFLVGRSSFLVFSSSSSPSLGEISFVRVCLSVGVHTRIR